MKIDSKTLWIVAILLLAVFGLMIGIGPYMQVNLGAVLLLVIGAIIIYFLIQHLKPKTFESGPVLMYLLGLITIPVFGFISVYLRIPLFRTVVFDIDLLGIIAIIVIICIIAFRVKLKEAIPLTPRKK